MDTWSALAVAFPLGLATSLHCVGMCGGIVMAVGGAFTPGKGRLDLRGGWAPGVLYHTGRGITYVSIGVAVGAAGSVLEDLGATIGFHYLTMAFTIAVLIAVGLHLLGLLPVSGDDRTGSGMADWLGRLLKGAASAPGAFTLGALTGFLPCGPLYGAFAVAVATGRPASGAAVMLAFWAGTVPLLLALGHSSSLLISRLRKRAGVAVALVVITVAISLMAIKIAAATDPSAKQSGHCHEQAHGSTHKSAGHADGH